MDEISATEPQGIVALLIDPTGRVAGQAMDFSLSGYGGFQLWEAQRMRAKSAATRDYVQRHSSPVLSDHVGQYMADRIVDELRSSHGWRMHYVAVGHDVDPNE